MVLDPTKQKKVKYYKSGIYTMIAFMVFSLINVFSYTFSGNYYIFSSYLSLVIIDALVTVSSSLIWLALIITIVLLLPYLFCAIFARKHYGFMIAGLVLISFDTALLLFNVISLAVTKGDAVYLGFFAFDIIFHALAVVDLAIAVGSKDAVKHMKENYRNASESTPLTTQVLPNGETVPVLQDNDCADCNGASTDENRQIVITRKKSFYGCVATFDVIIDGVVVGKIKNGASLTVMVSSDAHALSVCFQNGSSELLQITSGASDRHYVITPVMKMSGAFIKIDEE